MNEKFLEAYKALEVELRLDNITVLDYENSLEGTDQEKLKVCRIMRNYMSHNDTTFIQANNDQIKFINNLILEIRKKSHTVKDEMKRIKTMKYSEPIKNILTQIVKYPIVPIETKDGSIYLVDKDIIIKQLASNNKKIIIPTKIPKYKYLNKTDRMDSISTGTYIVTNDGTANGTYLGILVI